MSLSLAAAPRLPLNARSFRRFFPCAFRSRPSSSPCWPSSPPASAIAWQDPDWDKDYILSATSTARAEGVAAGSTRLLVHSSTGVFPGTVRRVWIHLPAESILKGVGDEGLAVIILQDGHAYVDE